MLNELNTNYWKLLLYNWYTTSSSHLNILTLFTNTLHVIFANNLWTFAAFSFKFIVQFLPFKLIIISNSNIFHTDITTTSICCWKILGFIYLNTQKLMHFVDKNGRKGRGVLIAMLQVRRVIIPPLFSRSTPPFMRFLPFQKLKMSPPFIGLSGKQKYWLTLEINLYIISILKVS